MDTLTQRTRHCMRSAARSLIARLARTYVTGPHLADAMQASYALHRQGFRSTVCFWSSHADGPRQVTEQYLAAIDAAADQQCGCVVSVKAPPLKFSRILFGELVQRARTRGVTLQLDSQSHAAADDTFALLGEF